MLGKEELHLGLDQTKLGFGSFWFIFLFVCNMTVVLGGGHEDQVTKTQNVGK